MINLFIRSVQLDAILFNFAFAKTKRLSHAYVEVYPSSVVEGQCCKYSSQLHFLHIVHSDAEMEILSLRNSFETAFYVWIVLI